MSIKMINVVKSYSGPADARIDLPTSMEIDSEIIRTNGLVLSKGVHYICTPLYIELLTDNLHLGTGTDILIAYAESTEKASKFKQYSFVYTDPSTEGRHINVIYKPSLIRSLTLNGLPLISGEYVLSGSTFILSDALHIEAGDVFDIKFFN